MAELTPEEVGELERRAELSSPHLSPSPLIERLDLIEAQVNGIPLIGEAIATLIHETQLLRDAINDFVDIRARQLTHPREPKRLIVQAIIASWHGRSNRHTADNTFASLRTDHKAHAPPPER